MTTAPNCLRLLVVASLFVAGGAAEACTGIRVKPRDGSVITARTLEFAVEMRTDVIVVPRGKAYTGAAPGGKAGLKWTTKYGAVGGNALGLPHLVDGLNEKGLGVGLFYFPGAEYQEVGDAGTAKALAPWELGTYLLTTCANGDEAVQAARQILVGATVFEEWQFSPPIHYRIHDASGKSYVLEYLGGRLHVHENPLGVMSNAPAFDWHVTNLRNYVNLSVLNVPPVELDQIKLSPFGQGSGMLGLPGDFTPPSRFVRAVAFSKAALPVDKADDGVKQAFHILNQFDIPKGAAREKQDGKEAADYTQWTSVSDLTNRRFFMRTYENQRLRLIDLTKCDLDAREIKVIPMSGKEAFEDVTGKAK